MRTLIPLFKIEYLLIKRNLVVLILSIGMPVFFFVFYASFLEEGQQNILKIMMLNMTAFSSLSFTIFSFPSMIQEDRKNNRLRHLKHSPLPMWQYYFVKICRIVFYYLISILTIFLIGHFYLEINMSLRNWFLCSILLLSGATSFLGLSILLCQIKSQELLSVLSNIIYFGFSIIGGLWIPISSFPKWLQELAHFFPTFHFSNLLADFINNDKIDVDAISFLIGYFVIFIVLAYYVSNRKKNFNV